MSAKVPHSFYTKTYDKPPNRDLVKRDKRDLMRVPLKPMTQNDLKYHQMAVEDSVKPP